MWPNFPALVTILVLAFYAMLALNVGRMRGRHNVQAPAISGAAEFERAFRVHQNTQEQLVLFLPALWLFAVFVSSLWSGLLGLVWLAGRVFYVYSYTRDPATRGPGFGIAFFISLILLVGALVGVIVHLF